MKHILVTGATGFIGSHTIKKLVEKEMKTSALIRENKKAEKYLSDVLKDISFYKAEDSIFSLAEFLKREQIDCVIHLATKYITHSCAEDIKDLIESNIEFGVQVLEAMKLAGVRNFINTGTSWQHYNQECYNPVNMYAATKQGFEDMLHYYTQAEKIHAITLEIYDTYGANDNRNKIINQWKKCDCYSMPIRLSFGEQKLDYVFIDDVTEAILQAVNLLDYFSDKDIIYEKKYAVSLGKSYTLKEIAQVFEQVYHTRLNLEWGAVPYRKREVFEPYRGTERLPGWKARYDLKEGFEQMYQEEQKGTGEQNG